MQNKKKIKIFTMDTDMASVICQNSKANLSAFLKRLNVYVEEDWDKDVLALTLKDIILDNPEYILYIHGKEILSFMIQLWESNEMEFGQAEWAMIGQLKLLGFVDFVTPVFPDGQMESVHVIQEAKDAFYFYLKSKTTRRLMNKYENWESVIRGMMSFYGIISFNRFYFYFCKTCQEPVDDEIFHLFLSVRINLLSFGGFSMEKYSQTEYYQNYEASNPENILESCTKDKSCDYFLPKYNEAYFIGNNNGLGDWEGISEIASVLMDDLELEYYRTIVVIKTSVLMIQNGEKFEDTLDQFFGWCPEGEKQRTKIKRALMLLYDSVPVYNLKGWSRKALNKKTNYTPSFKVLRGGKIDKKKGGNRNGH